MTTSTIICLVRDEAPYLLEWVAWYRLLGADRLAFYDNDSTDGTTALLAALQAIGAVDHIPWPDQPGQPPQLRAYADAIARCRTAWIGFLDVDEFLALPRHASLPGFLAGFGPDCGAVAVNQRVIGANGHVRHTPGLVTERFPLGSDETLWLNQWVKTLARPACIAAPGIHGQHLSAGQMLDAQARPITLQDASRAPAVSHRVAYYNHYILKSQQEYLAKRRRGQSDRAPEDATRHDKYSEAFFRAHDIARTPDPFTAASLPALRREIATLQALLGGATA